MHTVKLEDQSKAIDQLDPERRRREENKNITTATVLYFFLLEIETYMCHKVSTQGYSSMCLYLYVCKCACCFLKD